MHNLSNLSQVNLSVLDNDSIVKAVRAVQQLKTIINLQGDDIQSGLSARVLELGRILTPQEAFEIAYAHDPQSFTVKLV